MIKWDRAVTYNRRLAHRLNPSANTNRGEVVRMWRRRFIAVLRFLVFFIMALLVLTTKAC